MRVVKFTGERMYLDKQADEQTSCRNKAFLEIAEKYGLTSGRLSVIQSELDKLPDSSKVRYQPRRPRD